MSVPVITPDQHDFPPGLSQPALRALFHAGYKRLNQLTKVTEKEIADLHGMGPKGIRMLKEGLAAKGKSFAAPKEKKR
jgi:hypothetical protein